MSLAGLKKQFNKANQYVSEKMGAAEGTRLDEDSKRWNDGEEDLLSTLPITVEVGRTDAHIYIGPPSRSLVIPSSLKHTGAHTHILACGIEDGDVVALAFPGEINDQYKTRQSNDKTDITAELIENLILRTKEYLQPNPASRAKMNAFNSYAKMRGQARQHPYPQPEGVLGDTMFKYGGDLGVESVFGQSLIESGEALRQMAEVKYALEDQVRQAFLEPLHLLQTKDIKDLLFHRKKVESRRLDFDCKKRKKGGGGITDEEIKAAEEKFEESKALAETAMYSLLDNEVEQVSQLVALVEAQVEYHKQNAAILESLLNTLYSKRDEASMKTREPRQPKPPAATSWESSRASPSPSPFDNGRESPLDDFSENSPWGGGAAPVASPTRSPSPSPMMNGVGSIYPATRLQPMTSDTPISFGSSLIPPPKGSAVPVVSSPSSAFPPSPVHHSDSNNGGLNGQHHQPKQQPPQPSCRALYDFEPENEGELAFLEGDMILLKERIDDNWFEGTIRGKTGVFPVTYVEVVVDVPPK
ncbi:Endophilin-A [Hypsibius exemplaris]|uniref:Endophilin-A n=1 Tax=Hypsibius exemplaris TaxID=2072580 RepID=A0A9X6NF02_HYPEX|nr:Endophilin-A [Hypsibius exemplaris]